MNPQNLRQVVRAPADETSAGGGGGLAQAKESIASTARTTASRIKSAASDTASRAKEQARRFASDAKQRAANRLGGYGSAIHETADSAHQQDPNIAWATHRLAERVDSVADYIRRSDLADIKRDTEAFARRHPVAFFGGLFLGGIVLGNLLKAREAKPAPAALDDAADEESTSDADIPEMPGGYAAGHPSGSDATGPTGAGI